MRSSSSTSTSGRCVGALTCASTHLTTTLVPASLCAQGDRPAADIRLAYTRTKNPEPDGAKGTLEAPTPAPPGQEAAPQRRGVHIRFIWSQKTRNYIRCAAHSNIRPRRAAASPVPT